MTAIVRWTLVVLPTRRHKHREGLEGGGEAGGWAGGWGGGEGEGEGEGRAGGEDEAGRGLVALHLLQPLERTVVNYMYNLHCVYAYTILSYKTLVCIYALILSYVHYYLTYTHNSQSGSPTCPLLMYGLLYNRQALWRCQLVTRVTCSPSSSLQRSFAASSSKRIDTQHLLARKCVNLDDRQAGDSGLFWILHPNGPMFPSNMGLGRKSPRSLST